MEDLIFESKKPNGIKYINNIDFEIPIRIKNQLKEEYFDNEYKFYNRLEELIHFHTSNYLFPNHICYYYPYLNELKASKNTLCHLSNAQILKGEKYYIFRPIIEDIITNKVYTIQKSLHLSFGCEHLLPKNLFEFEEWFSKLSEHYYSEDDPIDFYNLACNIGDNALCLKELNRNSDRKKKRNIKKQIELLYKKEAELENYLTTCINQNYTNKEIQKIKCKIKELKAKL